ncbi:MAG: YfiR family protein [Acidobacteriota bacterium]
MAGAFAHAESRLSEYSVKAAYLFDFGKFVRYTSSADGHDQNPTFDICILGSNPFGHTLDDLTANETLAGKPVRVLRVKTIEQARACSIAYLSASERGRIAHDLDELRGQQVLTVSDASDFLREGGMIQFVTVGDHVRFAVNLNAAHKAQLNLSSELLKVALSVQGNHAAGVRP